MKTIFVRHKKKKILIKKDRTVKEIAWLAGILEGEGCFDFANGHPRIKVKMTDEDIVTRVAKLFNRVHNGGAYNTKSWHKIVYETSCRGPWAIGWMQTIYPFMGNRRREKIRSIIYRYSNRDIAPVLDLGQSSFS